MNLIQATEAILAADPTIGIERATTYATAAITPLTPRLEWLYQLHCAAYATRLQLPAPTAAVQSATVVELAPSATLARPARRRARPGAQLPRTSGCQTKRQRSPLSTRTAANWPNLASQA